MRSTLLVPVAVGATVLLAACNIGGGNDLIGKEWQLTAITETTPAFQGVIPAADQASYTIAFNTDGTFNATADCNQVSGSYETSGSNGLSITPGPSTLASCGEGSFGDLYVHALSRAASYTISGSQLTITLTDEGTLTFNEVPAGATATPASSSAAATPTARPTAKPTATPTAKPTATPTAKPTSKPTSAPPASPGAPTGLTGTTWQLTAITEKTPVFQGVVPADQQASYTIEFKADGTFSAKTDCDTLGGAYVTPDPGASSGALSIQPGPGSLAACAEGSLSDLYVLGLSNAASYEVADGQLTITLLDEGTLVLE